MKTTATGLIAGLLWAYPHIFIAILVGAFAVWAMAGPVVAALNGGKNG